LFGIALFFIIKFAKRGKKYNSAYDDESIEDELNQRKLDAKKSGKTFVVETKNDVAPKKSGEKSIFKKNEKDKFSKIETSTVVKSSEKEDEEALKG
jgi:hypothetical protein